MFSPFYNTDFFLHIIIYSYMQKLNSFLQQTESKGLIGNDFLGNRVIPHPHTLPDTAGIDFCAGIGLQVCVERKPLFATLTYSLTIGLATAGIQLDFAATHGAGSNVT
jgi:hypothetical protein